MIYLFLFFLMQALRSDGFGVDTNLWETAILLVLVVGCLHYLPIRFLKLYYTPLRRPRSFFWFFAFLLLFVVSLWRSNDFVSSAVGVAKDTLTPVLLLVFVYLYQQHLFRRGRDFSRLVLLSLVHAIGIFCIINLIAVVANPTFGREDATTLSLVGVHIKRVMFTLYPTTHANYVGIIGGSLFALSFERSLFGPGTWGKSMQWVYLFVGLFVVLISDSRSSLAALVVGTLAVSVLKNTQNLSLTKYSVLLVPFSSALFIIGLQFLATSSSVQSVARGDSDLATGNSRKFIYQAAANELGDFKPIHLVGYGEYGTYGSGITRYYMKYFGYENEEQILNSSVAHNTALQVIFDIGYLGLFVYLLLIFSVISCACRLYQTNHQEYLAFLYFVMYTIIIGVTTTRYGNYHEVLHQLFVLLCFVTFNTYNLSTVQPYHHVQSASKKRVHAVG